MNDRSRSLFPGATPAKAGSPVVSGASSPRPPSAPSPPQPAASIFGVEMFFANPELLDHARQIGAHWVRFAAFRWDRIQPSFSDPPSYNWPAVDEESLRSIAAYGLETIATVKFTPPWAQKVPGSICGPIKEEALEAFAAFLQAAVRRYGGPPYNIRYWELGNEPDVDPSIPPPGDPWGCWGDMNDEYYGGGYYAEMLKVAYPAIKAVDPNAQVLIGGMMLDCDPDAPPPGRDCRASRFLEGILRNGGGPYFDIAAFHVYSYWGHGLGKFNSAGWPGSVTVVPEKTAFVRRVLERYGFGDKPLMNSEGSMLCREAVDLCFESQAYFVTRAYAEALALGLQAQVWYILGYMDWGNSGLLHADRTPKPAYHAFRTASSYLGGARVLGGISGYPAGVEGYSFRRKGTGQQVDVIWSADWSLRTATLPAEASAYDPYGQLIASSGTIQVERSPVYVVAATRPAGNTLDVAVSQPSDDAEERASDRSVMLDSPDLDLGGRTWTLSGVRFQNVTIPQGASILEAHVTFTASGSHGSPSNLAFHGEASDHAATFTTAPGNLSGRPRTGSRVDWNPVPAWNTVGEKHQSPDLSPIIREIVGRTGWRAGNALVLLVTGSGKRAARTVEGGADPVRLHVVYKHEAPTCYSLTVNANPAAGGWVRADPAPNCGAGRYREGTAVALTAQPNSGYRFDNWSGNLAGVANPETVTMDGHRLVTAHFSADNAGDVGPVVVDAPTVDGAPGDGDAILD